MQSRRARLDRFISARVGVNRRDVRQLLAQGRVVVNNRIATDINHVVEQFCHVTLDGEILQANTAVYVMMNKPTAVVSATRDPHHKTVIALLNRRDSADLHIAGRLDYNSSGLLLLTNDGAWSRKLATPQHKVRKVYRVTLENPLGEDYIDAFAQGMYFSYEGIHTQAALLRILSEHIAEVTLTEGRYHQIKRMFGRFHNRVVALHRTAIGALELDPDLLPGQSRDLSWAELSRINPGHGSKHGAPGEPGVD